MIWFWIIVIAIVAVAGYISYRYTHKQLESGVIQKRDIGFIEQKHTFTTNVEFMDFFKEFESTKTGMGYTYKGSKSGHLTFTGESWEAEFHKQQTGEGEPKKYVLYFTTWKTRKGLPIGSLEMNALLTKVEKSFLALDPDTQVTRVRQEVKSR